MELTKGITLFNNKNSIDDCFFNNYKGETIGIYKPNSEKLGKYVSKYLNKGYKFIVYTEIIDNNIPRVDNLIITNKFYSFYKKSDLFIIENISLYQELFIQIMDIVERILILN